MYRILVVLFLSSFFLKTSLAQEKNDVSSYRPERFFSEIEFFAGPNLSSLRGNLEVDNNSQNERKIKVGYSLGISLSHGLGKSFQIKLGLVFEKKGGKSHSTTTYFDEFDQTFKQGTIEFEYDYKYLTIPIQICYLFGKHDQFNFGLGPYISYLDKQTLKRTSLFNSSIGLTDETDRNTKFDFGVTSSFAFKIPINSKISISCQVLNTLGLLNIRPNLYEGQTMKTNNISFLIGFITNR